MPLTAPQSGEDGHAAFFYGTLMAPQVLHRVCHGPHPGAASQILSQRLRIRPAILHGYRRHRVLGADYPAILPVEGEREANTADAGSNGAKEAKRKSNKAESESRDACVRGTLVEGLTDGDIWRLDVFEGEEYERKVVRVEVVPEVAEGKDDAGNKRGRAEEMECQTYVWCAGAQELEDKEWDFRDFVARKMSRWIGHSSDDQGIAEVDEAVAAQQRDPTGGRSINGSISKLLEQNGNGKEEVVRSAG